MNTIDDLLTILVARTPADEIFRITFNPRAWFLLRLSVYLPIHHIHSGFTDEELGVTNHGCEHIFTGREFLGINIYPDQVEAYRLWDREGREITDAIVPDPALRFLVTEVVYQ